MFLVPLVFLLFALVESAVGDFCGSFKLLGATKIMVKPSCEKGSCTDRIYRSMMMEEERCYGCRDLYQWSNKHIHKTKMEVKGVCHKLHPPIKSAATPVKSPATASTHPPSPLVSPLNFGDSQQDEPPSPCQQPPKKKKAAFPTPSPMRFVRRQRNKPDFYTAGPSNGTVLFSEKAAPLNKSAAQNESENLSRATAFFKRNPKQRTKTVDTCALNLVTSLATSEPCEDRLPRGGESKDTRRRRKELLKRGIDGFSRLMGGNNPTKTRAEIVDVAASQEDTLVPLMVCHACDPVQALEPSDRQGQQAKDVMTLAHAMHLHSAVVDIVQNECSKPSERRKYLAAFSKFPKSEIEQVIGPDAKISNEEYKKIRLHAMYPGAFKEEPKVEYQRCAMDDRILLKLLDFLDDPSCTQKIAYGHKIVPLLDGRGSVELDAVKRHKSALRTAADFIRAIDSEISYGGVLPQDRCTKCEKDTFRRCLKERNHSGNCKYTPKGGISLRTAMDYVETCTSGQLKKLSGLDDVKVLKGTENWRQMKSLAHKLAPTPHGEKLMTKRIDDVEAYYQTDFVAHLSREGTHSCNCLQCGFQQEGSNISPCSKQSDHRRSCIKCSESYAILLEMQDWLALKTSAPNLSILDRQSYEQLHQDIDNCRDDLDEYRSHLARHVTENDFDKKEVESLANDTCIVIDDFKMKILPCFFRENQNKWFGKKGIPCLGFMIVYNDLETGLKRAEYVMMLTNDKVQDEIMVACAKKYVYSNLLPDHCQKVINRTDGAGCFSSKLNRVLQPFWFALTGVKEISLRISPAGGGKTTLDGVFGRFSQVLDSVSNTGIGYTNADEILAAIAESNGVSATKFLVFGPDRSRSVVSGAIRDWPESVLRTELNEYDMSITAYRHSGYGNGVVIPRRNMLLFNMEKAPDLKARSDPDELLQCRRKTPYAQLINEFCGTFEWEDEESGDNQSEQSESEEEKKRLLRDKRFWMCMCLMKSGLNAWEAIPVVFLSRKSTVRFDCLDINKGKNMKESITSQVTTGQENRTFLQQQRGAKRVNKRIQENIRTEADLRRARRQGGQRLCDIKCPETGRYCRARFLTAAGYNAHLAKDDQNHDFPTGVNAKDKLLKLAAQTGGVLAAGTRTDRMSRQPPTVVESSLEATGATEARCIGKFNRKGRETPYHKPETLKLWMKKFYNDKAKLDAKGLHDRCAELRDPADGGLMFCHSKRGTFFPKSNKRAYREWPGCILCGKKPCECNGMLPPVAMCQNYINTQTQNKKKKAKENASGDDDNVNEAS